MGLKSLSKVQFTVKYVFNQYDENALKLNVICKSVSEFDSVVSCLKAYIAKVKGDVKSKRGILSHSSLFKQSLKEFIFP